MHPAPSIIFFTTASGAGYGLLFLLALAAPLGLVPTGSWFGAVGIGLALGLITAGLVSSTFHLKHPERAWRAVSQWRSSWLSREGLAALLTYVPALVLAVGWVLIGPDGTPLWMTATGLLTALGAATTVWCTGMIYASLEPVREWHQPLTPWLYVGFALMSGALLLHLLLLLFGAAAGIAGGLALVVTLVAVGLEALWRWQAGSRERVTTGEATGLGPLGLVRMVEPPHTQTNYLLTEMGYRIGRKHARKLRLTSLGLALATALLTALALLLGGFPAVLTALLAAITGLTTIAIGRWLFFAEATHTQMLYYGREIA
ncbi:MAG TPA: DmsC/YnfH family molybdoenzyme membrane anchor subunit [Geminicoccaceae bacterium]